MAIQKIDTVAVDPAAFGRVQVIQVNPKTEIVNGITQSKRNAAGMNGWVVDGLVFSDDGTVSTISWTVWGEKPNYPPGMVRLVGVTAHPWASGGLNGKPKSGLWFEVAAVEALK